MTDRSRFTGPMPATDDDEFRRDLGEIALEKFRSGRIDRRGFLTALAAIGVAPALGNKAFAAASEIIVCNWGGAAIDAVMAAWGTAFEAESGIPVVVDGSGPSAGKIRAQVEAGAVVWDVCDSGAGSSLILRDQGVTQEIDYSIVDKSKVLEGFAFSHGVTNYYYSYVMAWNPMLTGGKAPADWAEFFDTEKFPGKRTFRKSVRGMLEPAAMAMGIAPEEVYAFLGTEEGLAAAIEKFRSIRDHVIVWSSGSASQQLFLQEEVSMGCIWNTRGQLLLNEMPAGSFDMKFNATLAPGVWVVPKNNPAGSEAAMKFIRFSQEPAGQVVLLEMMGNGPANPEASSAVPEGLRPYNPSSPENRATQITYSWDWYGANQIRAEELYVDALIN
ncbi:ABC transporter substrate-binding protein [Paralimibaculum aggregatum]|uniref:ABC transporter substrate-binding protein n=1 Tax=Paralimibaculum aggregatum TaxID=3036245 RepID=A0ABQ6LF05_9RHOB|nr:ABC transporter substrate-binding protein [Limibaculum sp. NKW23]GMG81567.1 ABC transporter substrate-binding protein [Limibaculum sp. NKW23]